MALGKIIYKDFCCSKKTVQHQLISLAAGSSLLWSTYCTAGKGNFNGHWKKLSIPLSHNNLKKHKKTQNREIEICYHKTFQAL